MIVMDLKIDNFYAFKNFQMNMSYPKKIIDSNIENEFMKDRPNFRYKKVNIIMGGNATGKTSIGKMLMRVFNFIDKKDFDSLTSTICDASKVATFSIDIALKDFKLYRIETIISPNTEKKYAISDIKVVVKSAKINKNDSYESTAKKLTKLNNSDSINYIVELEKISSKLGWLFAYAKDEAYLNENNKDENYLKILNYTLKALDPSIIEVEKVPNVEDSYVIKTKHHNLIMQEGQVLNDSPLSSGTIAGIDIAFMISSIKNGAHGFYYCDEKFSYVHSDIEKAFLSLMINLLKDNDQLFFTTHNTDILELALPKHAYTFLKKDMTDREQPIKVVNAAEYLKRNTDSLSNAVDNDLFSSAPSLELIYEIEDI
ncbi:MAG: AAA family ATPase [Coprobacillaceae bacterium]